MLLKSLLNLCFFLDLHLFPNLDSDQKPSQSHLPPVPLSFFSLMSAMASKTESVGDDIVLETSPDGRFVRFGEFLGRGAFKVVHKGFDQESGLDVAWCQIKIDEYLPSFNFLENLLSEADLMRSLEHENITKCHSWWIDQGNLKINMITELFTSGTLRQYRNKHKFVNIKAIKNWGAQILEGLHYLHTHNPPIVHRDLKCDNIFVNGNNGQVKIGDLGLATVMQQHRRLAGVLGTPEFMAPELYDEDYDELVDVYSFGMCMLELITCEYPYRECNNVAQTYKKVTTGVKPFALEKVKDPQAKKLIEKCLLPASQRPSASELMKDPFFSSSKKGHQSESSILLPSVESMAALKPDSEQVSRATSSSVGSIRTAESSISTIQIELRLSGKKIDSDTISFNLYMIDKGSLAAKCLEFAFDLKGDDALKIALEMVEGKDLSYHQVPVAVELIDSVLLEIEPNWTPSPAFHHQPKIDSGCRNLSSNRQFRALVH